MYDYLREEYEVICGFYCDYIYVCLHIYINLQDLLYKEHALNLDGLKE